MPTPREQQEIDIGKLCDLSHIAVSWGRPVYSWNNKNIVLDPKGLTKKEKSEAIEVCENVEPVALLES